MEVSKLAAQQLLRKGEENYGDGKFDKDGISGLPMDIIGHIFSFLTMKDAVLHLPIKVKGSSQYVSWVNHVMKSIQNPTINALRIHYGQLESVGEDIDRWIKFAIDKRVERLDLDLTYAFAMSFRLERPNIFPLHICVSNSSFGSFRELSFEHVDISEEAVQYILDKCSHLEKLSIGHSRLLVNLKVYGPSLRLKYLQIRDCINLTNLQIVDALNLVSFTYRSRPINGIVFPLRNAPCLTELRFDLFCAACENIFDKLPSYVISQLKTLKISKGFHKEDNCKFPDNFPQKFKNVEHLELRTLLTGKGSSLFCFTPLLKACPSMRKLTVEIPCVTHEDEQLKWTNKEESYESLEVVKIIGFTGCVDMIEFALHLVDSSKMLKEMIIDPRPPEHPTPFKQRQLTIELRTKLPSIVKLVVL